MTFSGKDCCRFAMQEVARLLAIHPVEVYGVVSFYSFLSTKQQGHFVIRLCRTVSCDVLGKESEKIIEIIKLSGLKGRDGAGFPTHIKWELAAKVKSNKKYVVCNADEGEPGTFKDRVLLSDYSDVILEGMTIAGLVIGAKKGIIYLRGEYSYLLKNFKKAIDTRHSNNLLGNNILGNKDFTFNIDIRLGSGAYICGEETALIESLEGQRGEPRNRPPFPVDTGYNNHPTIVNNVETLAMVAHIIAKGPSWLKRKGTEKSSGTKLFSVSGNCKRPGIYEMPYGITINELLILGT